MNIQTQLKELIGAGNTQLKIADEIGVKQPTVSRMIRGDWSDTRLSIALKIQAMHDRELGRNT